MSDGVMKRPQPIFRRYDTIDATRYEMPFDPRHNVRQAGMDYIHVTISLLTSES